MMVRSVCALLLLAPATLAEDTPRSVEVELTILEVAADLQIADVKEIQEENLHEAIHKAEAAGLLEHLVRVRISTLDGQQARIQIGQTQPVISGRMVVGRGVGGQQANNVYQHQETGTVVELLPKVAEEGTVLLQIRAEQSRLKLNRSTNETDQDTDDAAPPAVITHSLYTTAAIPNGRLVLISGTEKTSAGKDQQRTLIVARATVAE